MGYFGSCPYDCNSITKGVKRTFGMKELMVCPRCRWHDWIQVDVCPECGVMHPPLPQGQKCPNAKVNLPSISDEEIGNFLASMRNIIISQIEKRQIKNAKKVFQQSIVILTKFLEEYSEETQEDANVKEKPQREHAPQSPEPKT